MKKSSFALFICAICLGIIFAVQFRSVEKMTEGQVPSVIAKQLESELNSIRNQRQNILKEMERLDSIIEEYKNIEADKDVSIKKIQQDIHKYKILNGRTKVTGPGISITLNNSELYANYNQLSDYTDHLLLIINTLNAHGAEAISINNERIVSLTEIAYIKTDNKLTINNRSVFPPFEIQCIGNPDKLVSILNLKYGLAWNIAKENRFDLKIEKKDKIEIPAYNDQVKFKYAKPIDASE
ncbi:DUF881 domain-containing protein [Thermotalea metallivorans]|uniref:Division initiation protein n=1 Tax=Thermotalea metallivorans TaxID=520762 RepID=A0A140LCF9_9FIRM|nr:DUF881 domain-containing protein [Thermotalea metallivorans]KXG78234.1 hypothetical protein AN619_02090 [Thermotalea metallivorans]